MLESIEGQVVNFFQDWGGGVGVGELWMFLEEWFL